MNFIENESEQKLRGGFYTDPLITSFLVKWISRSQPVSVLEPSCGDGAFLEALEQQCIPSLSSITACELDECEVSKARARTRLPATVLNKDFLRWYLFECEPMIRYDAVVGNPPFIRYQYLPEAQQKLAEIIFSQLRLPFTRHTNAWVPFVLASVRLLGPGGRLAMVVPSELLHIPHAQSLRRYLAEQCSRILILDPEEIWFGNTLQGTVLLLAEKKRTPYEKSCGVAVIPVPSRNVLCADPEPMFQQAAFTNGTTIEGKWMPVFLSARERGLVQQLRQHTEVKEFRQIASVDVGIVTGANKFFLVPDSIVEAYELKRWAHPMFGRSEHVQGLVFSLADYADNRSAGLPTNFLWFKEDPHELPSNVHAYLELGTEQGLHTRFKCRTRKPWYKVPSVHSAPIAMLKRAHHYPRLVLNTARALTTDTAYRINPTGPSAEALVFSFVNSLTCLSAEIEGRHYGGGVLELVPSEIERLLVPVVCATGSDLSSADLRYRSLRDDTTFLREQDTQVLGGLGLTRDEQDNLHEAWLKLRNRRHRTPSCEAGGE